MNNWAVLGFLKGAKANFLGKSTLDWPFLKLRFLHFNIYHFFAHLYLTLVKNYFVFFLVNAS
jgi:hypothetical protein